MSTLKQRILLLQAQLYKHQAEFSTPKGTIKPNFSGLAREYHLDRRTVAKIYNEIERGEPKEIKKRQRRSKYDPYTEEVQSILQNSAATIKSTFDYLASKYGRDIFNSYSSFKAFVKARNLYNRKKRNKDISCS